MKVAPGIELIEEQQGSGQAAQRGDQVTYNIRLFLNHGDEVRINEEQASQGLPAEIIRKDADRIFIDHRIELGKRRAIPGIERSLMGMRPGGYRKVRVGPHLAWRDKGIAGLVPPNAVLVVEIWLRDVLRTAPDQA